MKTQPTRTITGRTLWCLVILMMALSFKGYSQAHLQMHITNCTVTPNEFQFDFLLTNDGTLPLKLNSASFRMTHSAAIVPAGAHTYSLTYVPGSSDFPAVYNQLGITYSMLYTPASRTMQLTMSLGNYVEFNAPVLPIGVPMHVGRFSMKITDTDWVPAASVGMAYVVSGNGAVIYVNGATTTTTFNTATPTTFTANPQCPLIIPQGCGSVTLNETASTPVSCFGGSNGTSTLALSSGTTPVVWLVDGNSVPGTGLTNTITGLTAGPHIITATDATACEKILTITTTGPAAAMSMGPCTSIDAICNGGTGSVTAGTITDAAGLVTYSWTNSSSVVVGTTATVSNLPAGTYTLTVNDGCTTLLCVVNIAEPAAISSSFSVTACDSYMLPWGGSVTTSGAYTHVYSSANGCDSTVTANVTINQSTSSSETITECDSYTWSVNGQTYTVSGIYTFIGTNAAGCPHTYTLDLTINLSSSSSESATACDSYTWAVNGQTYTMSGVYTFVGTNAAGCPHTYTLNLTVNQSTSNTTSATACDSYTWAVNGQTYTMSGTYTDVSTNPAGCPHTETLVLTINQSTSSTETVTECDTYTWAVNGQTYTMSGIYTFVGINAAGCPHTYTLDLTINLSSSSSESATACDSYTWAVNGQTYTMSGVYTFVGTNAAGCPHTYTLNLTVNLSTSNTTTISACDSYTWAVNGQTYTMSGTYTDVSTNPAGCPHTETLVLTINNSTSSTEDVTSCDSYTWAVDGMTYTMSGVYTFVGTNAAGCPHTYTLNLAINESTSSTSTITECDSFTWSVNGQTYTSSGIYTFVGVNPNGCPNTFTLDLTINNSTSNTTTIVACDSYTWAVNGQTYMTSGTYTDVSVNAAGCPHTETLILTINQSTSSTADVTACDSYTWSVNGQTYTASGVYTFVGVNAVGCPHEYTLNLTINLSSSSMATVVECDSFTWPVNGQTYMVSGIYTFVGTNPDGCPHTYTLDLTINQSTSNTTTISACDSYTWAVNGQTYMSSGTYTDVSTNAAGCSHTETLILTIDQSTSSTADVTACDSYTWSVNGQTYTASGVYTFVGVNAAGCPHEYTLNLTINLSSSSMATVVECDSYTWPVNGLTYTGSGIYTFVGTNPDGCPHTYTLDLTINLSTSNTTTIIACDSYTWPVNGQTYTLSGTYNDVSTNAAGCPHTETLMLTINNSTSSVLTAYACNGGSYVLPDGNVVSSSGIYTAVIQNANGCDSTITVDLTVLSPIIVTVNPGTIVCYGGTTCINVSASGGLPPYTGTGTICGYAAGMHLIEVTDAAGCVGTFIINLNEPAKINVATTTTDASCAGADGTASATPSGGAAPYSYSWAPGGQTGQTATGLAGGNYVVTVTDANGCTSTAAAFVNSAGGGSTTPPGPITGPNGACKLQCLTYSVDPVPGATSYIWTLPSGATGSSTTNSITVCFSTKFKGGFLCVKTSSACGTSLNTCKTIARYDKKPPKPGSISGQLKVCTNLLPATYTYCVAPVKDADIYNWVIDGSASNPLQIVSGQGTNCLTILVPAGYTGSQKLKLRAQNCKGISDERKVDIKTQTVPNQPGSISGPGSVCKSDIKEYSNGGSGGATSYTWSVTGGATIISGQGQKDHLKIDFSTAVSTTAVISVVANNDCGSSVPRTKTVNVNLSCRVTAPNQVVSGNESNSVSALTAYPNPNTGKFTVAFNSDRTAQYSIKVVDLIGKVMYNTNISSVEGYNMKEISLDGVAQGLYFISVQTEGEDAQTMRIVVE